MPKNDSLTHFLLKNEYNDVLCINGSKVTALNVFYHSTFASPLTWPFPVFISIKGYNGCHGNNIDNEEQE